MGKRIAPERIDPELAHDNVGPVGVHERRYYAGQCMDEKIVVRFRRQRDIHAVSLPLSRAGLMLETGTREKGLPRFVQRQGKDLVRIVEGLLNTVAVMGVYVDVGDSSARSTRDLMARTGSLT